MGKKKPAAAAVNANAKRKKAVAAAAEAAATVREQRAYVDAQRAASNGIVEVAVELFDRLAAIEELARPLKDNIHAFRARAQELQRSVPDDAAAIRAAQSVSEEDLAETRRQVDKLQLENSNLRGKLRAAEEKRNRLPATTEKKISRFFRDTGKNPSRILSSVPDKTTADFLLAVGRSAVRVYRDKYEDEKLRMVGTNAEGSVDELFAGEG